MENSEGLALVFSSNYEEERRVQAAEQYAEFAPYYSGGFCAV